MGLSDVAGILSRFFVVGFFVPAFFALVVLDQLLSDGAGPAAYREADGSDQLLILGGVALLIGLLLSGLHHQLLRLYEGYPLRPIPFLYRRLAERWQQKFDRLECIRSQKERSPERTRAARQLDERFPQRRDLVLPTRLGNVMRAFENHPRSRYNLNGVIIWPRIELLMSADEHERLVGERTTLAFFINGSALAVVVGGLLVADVLSGDHGSFSGTAMLVAAVTTAAIVGSWVLYWLAVDAATGYGYAVRAAMDLHRLDLYTNLGVKLPTTIEDEAEVAGAVNRCLRYGAPIPSELREPTSVDGRKDADG